MAATQTGVRDIYVDANGIRHHLVSRGHPGAPIVFFLHGLSGQAHSFDGIATRLALKYHVYSLDVRGRGESGWGKPGDYHLSVYVEDLEAVREALGIERFTLVGSAMGGLIALHYAPRHSDHVAKIVLNDIGPEIDAQGLARIRSYITDAPQMFPDLKSVVRYYKHHYAPMIAHLSAGQVEEFAAQHVRKNDAGVWVWKMDPAVRALNQASPPMDLWADLKMLTCPVLVVRGTESDVLSAAVAARMAQENPRVRVVQVPGVGHAPVLTENVAVEAIEAFLAG